MFYFRALTSDLTLPLPALKELRLDGNDISIVAKSALESAHEIRSLSLQDNPLSCDCTLKPFAQWLLQSKVPSQDLLGAVCATPPHLEGAPLLEIPEESFKCQEFSKDNDNEHDNDNVLEQIDEISKQGSQAHGITDSSDVITLQELRYTRNSELIFYWNIRMRPTEYTCDAIFVYKEENIREILLDNSPVSTCKSKLIA